MSKDFDLTQFLTDTVSNLEDGKKIIEVGLLVVSATSAILALIVHFSDKKPE